MYNHYRKWRNHKHGFPRYRVKTHLYAQITDVFFIYSLFVHCINIIVNKATFMVVEIISPIIRNIRNSIINTTSLSQSCSLLYVKWEPHLLILISYVNYYSIFLLICLANKNRFHKKTSNCY